MNRHRIFPAFRRHLFRVLAFVSLGLFITVVLRLDVGRIWDSVIGLGWKGLVILFTLRLAYWVLRACGWAQVLRAAGGSWLPCRLLAARLAGHSVAYLTPAARLGGEVARVLQVRGVDRTKLLSSAVVDKTVEFLATLTCVAAAFVLILVRGSVSAARLLPLVAVSAASAAGLFWLYRRQRRGLFAWLLAGLTRIRLLASPLEARRKTAGFVDARIAALYREKSRILSLVLLIYLGLMLVWAVEVQMTFLLMGSPEVSFLQSFVLVSLGSLALLVPALPASLGFYEITYMALFVLLGINPEAGTALIMVRRVLGLVWAGIGLVPLWHGRGLRASPGSPNGPSGSAG